MQNIVSLFNVEKENEFDQMDNFFFIDSKFTLMDITELMSPSILN